LFLRTMALLTNVLVFFLLHFLGIYLITGSTFFVAIALVLKERDVKGFISLIIVSLLVMFARYGMMLDDLVFPSLKEMERQLTNGDDRIVFILGMPRSGTTSTHDAITSHEECTSGISLDVVFPSLLTKFLFGKWSLRFNQLFLDIMKWDVPNHKFGLTEKMEEHFFNIFDFQGFLLNTLIVTSLGKNEDFFARTTNPSAKQFEFMKKCLVRILYYQGQRDLSGPKSKTNKMYIGCPLGYSSRPENLLKFFPKCKLVVCVRDPAEVMPSIIDLSKALRLNLTKKDFEQRMPIIFNHYVRPLYKSLADATETFPKKQVYYLSFPRWKEDAKREVKLVWKFLGLDPEIVKDEFLSKSTKKKETHKNKRDSYELFDYEELKREFAPYYDKILKRCDHNEMPK